MSWFKRHKRRWQKIFGGSSSNGDYAGSQTIQTPSVPGVFLFGGIYTLGTEYESKWKFSIGRDQGASGAVSVDWETFGGSAVPGVDYESGSGTLTWADGDSANKDIEIQIHDNLGVDPAREFYIRLKNPTGGASIGPVSVYRVVILDNDSNNIGITVFRPASLTYKVLENGGSVTVEINRGGSLAGAVGVTCQTANGTALAGTHYTATGPTVLSWADGEGGTKTFSVPIVNVGGAGGNKIFYVNLSAPTGQSAIDTGYSQIEVEILDDESFVATPGQAWIAPVHQVTEGQTLTVYVYRIAGSTGAASVKYVLEDITALADQDYLPASGTLTWLGGDAQPKSFNLTTIPDSGIKPSTTLRIRLLDPTGGMTIHPTGGESVVTIAEKDKLTHYVYESFGFWEGRTQESAYDFGFTYERTREGQFSSLVDGVIGSRVGNETNRGASDYTLGAGGGLGFGLAQTPVGGDALISV